jgi:hypothetical protein
MATLVYGKQWVQLSHAETSFKDINPLFNVMDPGAHPPIELFWPLKYLPYVERLGWAKWKPLCDYTTFERQLIQQAFGRVWEAIEEQSGSGILYQDYIEQSRSPWDDLWWDEIQ